MERRCQGCGAHVSESAKFCRSCGGRIETIVPKSETHQCPMCNKEIPPGAKFCRHCGSKLERTEENDAVGRKKTVAALTKPLKSGHTVSGATSAAPETSGESVFMVSGIVGRVSELAATSSTMGAVAYTGPLRVLFSGSWHLFKGFFGALKSPRKLMPGFLLGLIWFVLSVLPSMGIALPGRDIASWLTFAQGGLQGGIPGAVGGVLGKGVFAAALTGLFMRNSHPVRAAKGGDGAAPQQGALGLLMIGMGLSLILYNFFTWNNGAQNSMIGIVAAIGTLRAMGREHGFLRRLVTALVQRFSPKRLASPRNVSFLGGGLSAGFALSVPMSLIAGPWTGYAIGVVSLLPGIMIAMRRNTREVVK